MANAGKVLVTGATGNTGSGLVPACLEIGATSSAQNKVRASMRFTLRKCQELIFSLTLVMDSSFDNTQLIPKEMKNGNKLHSAS